MSALTNYKKAVALIEANDNLDYSNAIIYYQQLKERMFDALQIDPVQLNKYFYNGLKKQQEAQAKQLKANINKELNTSSKLLQELQSAVISKMSSGANIELQNNYKKIQNLEKKIEISKKEKSQLIEQKRQEILNVFGGKTKIRQMVQEALYRNNGITQGDLNTIINFLSTFLINNIKWYMENPERQLFVSFKTQTTLAGYFKELIEQKALQQIFNNYINVNVKNISTANSIEDLIIQINNLDTSQSQTIIQNIDDIPQNVLNNIYGVQIKLRDLFKVKTDFMKISHQANLKEGFNAQMPKSGFNKMSWACGVIYLGQLNNIKQALGENNVMFINGPNRMFMHDFISNFRNQMMYLSFAFDEDRNPTSQIGLQRYVSIRGKQKNRLLSRFSNKKT